MCTYRAQKSTMSQTIKGCYTALEAAQVLMYDWRDGDDKNEADLVIFLPEKTDGLTDDEEVNENTDRLGYVLTMWSDQLKLIPVATLKVQVSCYNSLREIFPLSPTFSYMYKIVSVFFRLSKYGKRWI